MRIPSTGAHPHSARSCVMGHNGVMDINAENTAPSYDEVVARIADDAPGFWLEQAANLIDWVTEPTRAVDDSNAPIYRWYPDGELNVCYNAVDRHVENGRGDQAAIIYDSPVTDTVRTITYTQLQDEVSRFARALSDRGVAKGDRVVIYMPMIPEAAVAMLACARLGAIHSVVFGGFAPNELAVRIDDTAPTAVISTSCGVEKNRVLEYKPMLDEAIDIAENKPEFSVIVQRDEHRCEMGDRDVDYAELLVALDDDGELRLDRKSTRLNSSHVAISYAVFCVKKKLNIYLLHHLFFLFLYLELFFFLLFFFRSFFCDLFIQI